jgi:dienelactone hydrolase
MSERAATSMQVETPADDPEHVVLVEPVPGSEIPVRLMYVELLDGVYAPIGLRLPHGQGPFPLVLFASGNGGGGMAMVREFTRNRSWTQEQFLARGYAVAWLRYRAEVDYAYDRIGRLIEDRRQGRQLLNRGPLEYEDAIAIAEYVKTLPEIDADRIGYMGVSHGGEMAFKIASEYHGIGAMVASEPAAHEFLRLKPDQTAHINPATGLLDVESMLMREAGKVRARISEDVARERVTAMPTVPTIAEAGVPNYQINAFHGILGPAGMPPAIVARLQKDITEVLKSPDVNKRLIDLGFEPVAGSGADLAAIIERDLPVWRDLVQKSGAKAE